MQPYKFRNATDIYSPQIKQLTSKIDVERIRTGVYRFLFNDWIYELKFRGAVNEWTLSQNGLFYSNNEIKTDPTAKKFIIDFISNGDKIEVYRINQNGKAIRSIKTIREYCQILLLVNALIRIGKFKA